MNLVKCKECEKEINKRAEICPYCGCRVKSNVLKTIIICLMSIYIPILICYVVFSIPNIIKSNKEDSLLLNYYGEYEFVSGNIYDINQLIVPIKKQYNNIKISKENIKLTDSLHLAQNKYYLYKDNNEYILYGGVHMFAEYNDGHSDLDLQLCFKLNDTYLIQIDCPFDYNEFPHFRTNNVKLEYKKIQ